MYTIEVQERVSKKTGNKYKVLIISFPNGYEKMVFLDSAELFMFEELLKQN